MRSEPDAKITENRRAHTVYLTPALWNALERRHLELRLQGSDTVSKIEFVEQVLLAGLDALSSGAGQRRATQSPKRSDDSRSSAKRREKAGEPASASETPVTQVAPEAPEAAETVGAESLQAAPSTAQPRRRTSALERLKQASDPGRPAPIHSAADRDDAPEASG